MAFNAVEIPQLLWTTVCPNCGYSLEGLARQCVCPECGRACDQSQVILHGWGRGGHESLGSAKPSRLGFVLLPLTLFFVLPAVLSRFRTTRGLLILFLPQFLVILLRQLYFAIRRRNTDHPGLVQSRLGDWGCVQYDDLAGPSPLRDFFRAYIWLVPTAATIGLAVALWEGWIAWLQFICYFPFAVILAPLACASSYRFQRARRKLRDGAIADLNEALCRPTPWTNVSHFQLENASKTTYRLRVHADFRFFTFRPNNPVDAEITCTSEQAEQLKGLIEQWIARSRDRA